MECCENIAMLDTSLVSFCSVFRAQIGLRVQGVSVCQACQNLFWHALIWSLRPMPAGTLCDM